MKSKKVKLPRKRKKFFQKEETTPGIYTILARMKTEAVRTGGPGVDRYTRRFYRTLKRSGKMFIPKRY